MVVGDGLTGIEAATEIAEARPGLSVTLIARGRLGARLSAGAGGHLRQACDRLGITVLEHTSAEAVEATRVLCADGTALASDATVWTAGFGVSPIAAAGHCRCPAPRPATPQRQAIEAIVGRLTGRKIAATKLIHNCNLISLGRRDGILQTIDDEGRAKPKHRGGRKPARIKGHPQDGAVGHLAPHLRHAQPQAPPGRRP
ncbi:FAD-dependent oxidoreductase [Nonomuraea sp. NPDC001831]|uniref:FAD-dependent oxidoreductase n=1 Tax=Nonomuraea sp. NPDC001831 TaxID=3364340 RepID=UPI0036CA61DF